ncbi:TPA: type II toxin-antitoxin system HicB family antitoxin [Enterococcus faecalis]|jgi:predicted RNase H-like HicB family nuclease|nr:type II toxin-antitoxin system HicB family antitoxin [Enterococcus faecalis]HBC2749449.1 type II toxin-antitoxin system HicB family antitoxin [Enterococcus faecalis]HDT7297237.1 type II toxin-antitoxin system HicB family antitoxin [Enterococcus faecalis]
MFLYYAIFNFDDDGINVSFPDLDGAFTGGADMHEALFLAKDLLAGWLINAQDDGESLPVPSAPSDFHIDQNDLVVPIEVNLDIYRAKFDNQLIKKTLTIPKYLNIEAEALGINFSQTLTEALKDKLSV